MKPKVMGVLEDDLPVERGVNFRFHVFFFGEYIVCWFSANLLVVFRFLEGVLDILKVRFSAWVNLV